MSEEQKRERPKLPVSPHLERVFAEGASDALPLRGYIGPSTDEEHVSLYPNLNDLSTSIEVARADVLHSAEAPRSLLPNDGGMIIWVRKDAKITHRRTETVEVHKGRLRMRFNARPMQGLRMCSCVPQCIFWPPPPPWPGGCTVCQSNCKVCQSQCQFCHSG